MPRSLFAIAVHWLSAPLHDGNGTDTFLQAMADAMTKQGRAKSKASDDGWAGWTVTNKDILQWIGVWYYFLAFPQTGDREQYWRTPVFGPIHRLKGILALGQNGEKGRKWFLQMHAAFALPSAEDESDPFSLVRPMWDSFAYHFNRTVTAGWLICLDESMVKWVGRNMPGMMVVQRKPTPIGAELHTLCCAQCGVITFYELYEGKGAMARKEFCSEYKKSVALTLRCVKEYFGSVRARFFLALLDAVHA